MEENPKIKWLKDQAVDVFKQSFCSELYGFHLFEIERLPPEKEYYLFEDDEKGDAVWLVQPNRQQQEYKVRRVEEAKKLSSPRPLPVVCRFWHDVRISMSWLVAPDISIENIQKKVIKGGRAFAQRINQAYVDVLMTSVDSKVPVEKVKLDDILAEVSDGLSREGFSADRFLFPKDFQHRLVQQEIITQDDEIQNDHYVGRTKTGLYAFWSSELSGDTGLIFDSTAGVTITWDPRFNVYDSDPPSGVWGKISLNPIVKDIRSVIAIEGVGQVIDHTPSRISSVLAASADEPAVIDEIRSTLNGLPFLKATKTHLLADFEDVAKTYQNEAYKACVVMCGAVMEGLLLGNLEKASNIKLLWNVGRLTNFALYPDVRSELRKASLEDLINHTRKSNCIDGFTDEVARMVQRCRNSIHPGRVLRGDEVLDAFDKKAADLALSFLNVLCSLIAKS